MGHQVLDISAGKNHTLGIFYNIFGGPPNYIFGSRYAVGWGANNYGQASLAGLGSPLANTGVLKVAAGDTYSLVVKNPNKSLYFWGNYVGYQGTFNSPSFLLIGTGVEDITNNLILLNNGKLIEIGDALRRGLTAEASSYAFFPSQFATYLSGSYFDRNNFFNIDLNGQQLSLRRTPNSTILTAFDKDLLTITGGNLKITSGSLNSDFINVKTGSISLLAVISGTIENPILGIQNTVSGYAGATRSKILGDNNIEAFSAGSKPSGIVNLKAIAAMRELGYDLSVHDSKSLDEVKVFAPFDGVITMGCGDACPWMPAKQFIDWQIPDPKHMEPAQFNQVRDFIESKVKMLLEELS